MNCGRCNGSGEYKEYSPEERMVECWVCRGERPALGDVASHPERLTPIGYAIDKFFLNLQYIRDLEAYEGSPILSEYRASESGNVYIEKWCTHQDGVSRFLLVRSSHRLIVDFLTGRQSMLDLLKKNSDGFGFLIDRDSTRTVAVALVWIAEVPQAYLPRPERFHVEAFRPESLIHTSVLCT